MRTRTQRAPRDDLIGVRAGCRPAVPIEASAQRQVQTKGAKPLFLRNTQIISAVPTHGHKRFSTAMTIATDRPAARAAQISAELEGAAHTRHKSRHLSDRHSKTFDPRNPQPAFFRLAPSPQSVGFASRAWRSLPKRSLRDHHPGPGQRDRALARPRRSTGLCLSCFVRLNLYDRTNYIAQPGRRDVVRRKQLI
jgi:hypothetical protein